MNDFKAVEYKNGKLVFLDQTKLPLAEVYIETDDYERIAQAIERLEVRGAPQIGVVAAYGIALAFKNNIDNPIEHFSKVYNRLFNTRPTAVNLFWALNRMKTFFEKITDQKELFYLLINEAQSIHNDDVEKCDNIASNGLKIFDKPKSVLTHCNTGQLATGGGGTAFYVIKKAYQKKLIKFVYADETRPLLQGSRLTAFELDKASIPFKIITDSTAAVLMSQGKIDIVITGADRIASNGDTANKIGTYNLAVLCNYHNIPFYVAAPTSTIDTSLNSGDQIQIEERNKDEIIKINGQLVTKENYDVFSPAFDVTPHKLIHGIITEVALHNPPYNFR